MESLIHVVGEELNEWEEQTSDPERYSIITQHLMLAEKISRHQHLSPRSSTLEDRDKVSFHSAKASLPSSIEASDMTVSIEEIPSEQCFPLETASTKIGRPLTTRLKPRKSSRPSSPDWRWRPSIPHRTSSINTRRRSGNSARRPDSATFHRRSCQLFTSLDSTLSNATSTATDSGRTSTSTSPSLTYSVTTQATSILDSNEYESLAFTSLHLELQDPRAPAPCMQGPSIDSVRLGPRRSSSRLSPDITSTEQIYWTSETSRRAEYAKIDAAYSGLKGFIKKCLPRGWAWAHGKRRNFHQQVASAAEEINIPAVDDNSVRRFRINIASGAEDAVRSVGPHGVSRANTPVALNSELLTVEPLINLKAGYAGKELQKLVLSPKLSQRRAAPPKVWRRYSAAVPAKDS
ncbi:hypothetical protein LTR70_007054 [Exophiala xenobiotica]|uniref:Uncharacterized protein n=1 Tax=Lithohypha guttulata TaxID=1690604 RepID=A0ABR0K5U5_9EURO|nr:hypothetical protein LTR24_006628 [Lithohypha guttulata]KAK5314692.1 hypothetical protein LTR70_007054 [Exophiala xenobiotica]